ncbi:glycosyltransferase family 2 protein [Parabacteroides sp. OttesenSCG-928-N08]|nr:glycosyltransferase family 2 protein [Parabacteroides sp. OttesenSCG-928-N08]
MKRDAAISLNKNKKRVAVVILNWNGAELLSRFVPILLQHTPTDLADIVVADNGSTDHSIELLQSHFPTVAILAFDRNYGFAEGYNQAIRQLPYELVVLLNSDVEVTANWLQPLVDRLDADPVIAAVQPKIRSLRHPEQFEYAGACGGFLDHYGYPFCRGRILGEVETDLGQYDSPVELLWGSGACLLIRTAVYLNEGGLDGRFFAHQEEIDLCWRLNCRGYRILVEPASHIFHLGAATLSAESPRKTLLNYRNNLLMLYKNLPEARLKSTLRLRWWLDRLAALQLLLSGKPANARALLQGRREYRRMRGEYRSVREENLRRAMVELPQTIYRKSLLRAFLFGRRRYSDL